jgi:hypothetical protein
MTNVTYDSDRMDGAISSAFILFASAFAIVLSLTVGGLNFVSGSASLSDGSRIVRSAVTLERVPNSE